MSRLDVAWTAINIIETILLTAIVITATWAAIEFARVCRTEDRLHDLWGDTTNVTVIAPSVFNWEHDA